METKKLLGYIGGGCFALRALLLIGTLVSNFNILSLLFFAAMVLLALSLFLNKPVLAIAGGAVGAVYEVALILRTIGNSPAGIDTLRYSPVSFIFLFLCLVAFVLLLIAGASKGTSKIMGIIACAIFAIQALVTLPHLSGGASFLTLLVWLLLAAGSILLGLAFDAPAAPRAVPAAGPAARPAAAANTSDKINRLTQLKALLDAGVLSQEEFEAKKKDILS